MSPLETVILRRADEQTRTVRLAGYWERDSWDVPAAPVPRPVKRARCLAGDCADPVSGQHSYCRTHWLQITRGIPLDAIPGTRGRSTRRAQSEGTGA
jgi:hypothetical protein